MLWRGERQKSLCLGSEQESAEKAISVTPPGISLVKEKASLSTF